MLKTILAFGAMAAAVVSSVRDLTLTRSVHSKLFHPVNVPYVFDKIDVDLNVFKTEHLRGLTKKHDNKEPRHKKKEPDDDDDYSLILFLYSRFNNIDGSVTSLHSGFIIFISCIWLHKRFLR
jgi:hypothetical protein